jgi:hypothetical protein
MKVKCIKENSYIDFRTKKTVYVFKKGNEYEATLEGKNVIVTNEMGQRHSLSTIDGNFFMEHFKLAEEVQEDV